MKRELVQRGDSLLEAVEQRLLAEESEVPIVLAGRVADYAALVGWRRTTRDLVHAHDVVLAVQGELLASKRTRPRVHV